MVDDKVILEDDDLFNAQVRCTNLIEDWVGEKCEDCPKIVASEDIDLIISDNWLVSRNHEAFVSEPRCYECYKEHHRQNNND